MHRHIKLKSDRKSDRNSGDINLIERMSLFFFF